MLSNLTFYAMLQRANSLHRQKRLEELVSLIDEIYAVLDGRESDGENIIDTPIITEASVS